MYMYIQSLRHGKGRQLHLKTKRKEELPQAGLEPTTFCVLAGQAESLNVIQGQGVSSLINWVTHFSTVEWAGVIKPPRHPSPY